MNRSSRTRMAAGLAIASIWLGFVAPLPAATPGKYEIERYLNIRSATSPALSPDRKTVAFLTNISGSNQLWTIDAAGGWPEQRTFFTDRVLGVSWSPRGDWIAFGRDAGGNENFQIYVISPDGAKLAQLTDKPEVRHNLGPWSKDGGRLAWSSNEREAKYFDTYILDIDSRARTRIDAGDGLYSPAGSRTTASG